MELDNALLTNIMQGNVVLVLGSGFSIEAKYPSGGELQNFLIDECKPPAIYKSTLQQVAQYYEWKSGKPALVNILKQHVVGDDTSESVKILDELPEFQTIITTNWDSLLEDNLRESLSIYDSDTFNNFKNKTGRKIYHLHGSFEDTKSVVVTEKDYYNLYRLNETTSAMLNEIRAIFASSQIVFVGYSLSEEVFQHISLLTANTLGNLDQMRYLVTPTIDDTLSKGYYESFGVSLLKGKSFDFFNSVKKHIDNVSKDFLRKVIVDSSIETGLSPQKLNIASESLGIYFINELKVGETKSMRGSFGIEKVTRTGENEIQISFRDSSSDLKPNKNQ